MFGGLLKKPAGARILRGVRSSKRIVRQFRSVRNEVAADRELCECRYPKRIHDKVANDETRLRLGYKGTCESHLRQIGPRRFLLRSSCVTTALARINRRKKHCSETDNVGRYRLCVAGSAAYSMRLHAILDHPALLIGKRHLMGALSDRKGAPKAAITGPNFSRWLQ
jgi:hypothetical protein